MYAHQKTVRYFRLFSRAVRLMGGSGFPRVHARRVVLAFVPLAMAVVPLTLGTAQTATEGSLSPLTLTQVVNRMVADNIARATALESYRGTRTYTLVFKGFPSNLYAQMVVDITYSAPNSKTFVVVSQTGPKWIQDQVMSRLLKSEKDAQQGKNRKNVDLNTENYNFSELEYRPVPDHCSYALTVEPKTPSKYLYRGKIWINDREFAVCRIEAQPAKNPSFWIRSTNISHSYEKVGEFWLPERNKSVSAMRIGGRATLTIQYQNYKILAAKPVNSNVAHINVEKPAAP